MPSKPEKPDQQRCVSDQQRRNARKSASAEGIPRRKQAHGGALLTGGVPGNRGGGGWIKHGLYADLMKHPELGELLADFQANPKPLDTLQEVATIRALAVHLFNRVRGGRRISQRMIVAAVKILSEVTKAVKRIEDVRAQDAISRHEFRYLMHEMARVVREAIGKHVSDLGAREQITADIQTGWRNLGSR